MAEDTNRWKRCSSCKKDIPFSTPYQVCSVSTCNRKRTGMVFCSVSCWEVHLPMARHREAYSVEKRSPSQAAWQSEQSSEAPVASTPPKPTSDSPQPAVRRRVATPTPTPTPTAAEVRDEDLPRDILIVTSKLKKYIRARSGMNTSDSVLGKLSDHVRAICNEAIRNAAKDGRKTVLDRDIPRPPR